VQGQPPFGSAEGKRSVVPTTAARRSNSGPALIADFWVALFFGWRWILGGAGFWVALDFGWRSASSAAIKGADDLAL